MVYMSALTAVTVWVPRSLIFNQNKFIDFTTFLNNSSNNSFTSDTYQQNILLLANYHLMKHQETYYNIHLNESLMPKWVILKHKYFCIWEAFP